MKVCIVYLTSESNSHLDLGSNTPVSSPSSPHLIQKFITQETTHKELDDICLEICDYFWILPTSSRSLTNEEIKVIKYFESKKVPMLGPNSTFFSKVIRSDFLDKLEDLKDQIPVQIQKENSTSTLESQVSTIVVETLGGSISLATVVEDSVHMNGHGQANGNGVKTENGVKGHMDHKLLQKIKDMAVEIYDVLGITGSGYAKLHFGVNLEDNKIYLRKVSHPVILFGENESGEAVAIKSSFAGGFDEFIETIVKTKRRADSIIRHYERNSTQYASDIQNIAQYAQVFQELLKTYAIDGNVLDLGCGTGYVGTLVKSQYPSAILTGVDLCAEMAKFATDYTHIQIGRVENIIMELKPEYDHIVSFGVLLFLDTRNFIKTVNRMFALAKHSITFSLEDYSDEYIELRRQKGKTSNGINHLPTLDKLKIPEGWSLIFKRGGHVWNASADGTHLDGCVFHFRKNEKN